jgi:hypothetical protein
LPRLLVASLVCATFAACIGGGEFEVDAGGASFDDSTGYISGAVTDDQLAPLASVTVGIGGTEPQLTAVDGSFMFRYLAPGEYVVVATLDGYTAASRQVAVQAGATETVLLQLVPLASDAAYHETQKKDGLLGCSATIEGTFVYYLNCEALYIAGQHGLDRHILGFQVGSVEGVSGWWAETVWLPSQTFARALWILWGTSTGSQPSQNLYILYPFHESVSPSPHRQRFEQETLLKHIAETPSDLCAVETECELFSTNYSGHDSFTVLPAGIGVQVQQRFEQYLTTFHNGPLPEEFTVLPDA